MVSQYVSLIAAMVLEVGSFRCSLGRRSVDDDRVELGQNRFQLPAQEQLAIDFLCFQKVFGFNVNGVRKKFQLRSNIDEIALNLRNLVDPKAVRGETPKPELRFPC